LKDYAKIGQLVVKGCNKSKDDKVYGGPETVLSMLAGKVGQKTAKAACGLGRYRFERACEGKIKGKKLKVKTEKVVAIADSELKSIISEHANESCRFTSDGVPLLTVACDGALPYPQTHKLIKLLKVKKTITFERLKV
jgi:hypothetical protein